ncbi:hypothetical protein [Sulfitobacter aestuariivivens]|uniref:Ferrochelatase n=1 Tax=Sulfitobacter aestuariivivens TaxID=2766981 RepID=A0A927D4H1_9RHOB|nr:hypothetical protein [Sulfitobacter aestuariivivens]MBD3665010.1 hypothetical protein [Sulfitobacter aestuariivivens]
MTKIISIAALVAGMATASIAGTPVPPPADDTIEILPVAPSSAGLGVPLAIGAAVVGLALIANDDDDDVVTTTGEED